MTHHIGIIGLGTMGANLARNAARTGATVAVFNRTPEKTDVFMKTFGAEGSFVPTKTYEELVGALPAPRSILLMVKAGPDTDRVIDDLLPHLDKGDCIIDAGNSQYLDTERREKRLTEQGIAFIGMGVSGGEEGALKGPSMMPGGDRSAVEALMPLFSAMAADDGSTSLTTSGDGGKCVAYMGPGGAGHFVKMVHNGIEYGVMQLIAEAYHLLSYTRPERSADNLAAIFAEWNESEDLHSYLMEVTAEILQKQDAESGGLLLDVIQDTAKQKGTGRWTTEAALVLGVAVPTITAAVDARMLSALKPQRVQAASLLGKLSVDTPSIDAEDVRKALRCSIVTAYAQGFSMLSAASREYGWNLDLSEIARIWQGGCIIRASLLQEIRRAYDRSASLDSLLLHLPLLEDVKHAYDAWTGVLANGVRAGVPLPAMSASLAYHGQIFWERLPSNLIAAQRDYFGAHGFERTDREGTHHGDWY